MLSMRNCVISITALKKMSERKRREFLTYLADSPEKKLNLESIMAAVTIAVAARKDQPIHIYSTNSSSVRIVIWK